MARKQKKKTSKKKGVLRRLAENRWFHLGLLAVFLVGAVFVAWLDYRVRDQFEGRRFALPARVYARPLELFPGARVSADTFIKELQQVGYREGLRGQQPGRFERRGDDFRLVTRPLTFWDGPQSSLSLQVSFGDHGVRELSGAAGPLNLVRLDPEYIGGIYPAHNEDRVLVRLDGVPKALVNALLAVEDRKFYLHRGIDPMGMTRALVSTLSGRGVQGGSTITQQLVKNFFLTPERTLRRKFTEVVMALLLEAHYEKNDILETYINEVYLGQDRNRAIHGFGLGAQFYFGEQLRNLSLAESALLVGMVKGPSWYDPHRQPERALKRRNLTLTLMRQQGFISDEQYLQASAAPLGVIDKPAMGTTRYPAFLDLVRRQLSRDYRDSDLQSEGLQIFTTLDPRVQAVAEHALTSRLNRLDSSPDQGLQGAVIVTDTQNGEVQALVGDRDPRFPGFNRALDSNRPVGSVLKPAIYLTALSDPSRYTLATLLDDEPLLWQEPGRPDWSPNNYDHKSHGQVPLWRALARSYNIAAARLGFDLGVPNVLDTARKLGVERDLPPYASTLLGAVALSPLEVAQLYQTLSSGGFRVPLRAIREVLTPEGKPLQRYPLAVEQVVDPASAYLVTAALQTVVEEGTARGLRSQLPEGLSVAGKTGTTDDMRDSWFAGYSGDRVAVVWNGFDDNRPTSLTGASGAMRVWGDLMSGLDAEPLSLPLPDTMELVWTEPVSGLRADSECPGAVELPFVRGSAPTEHAPCARSRGNWFKRLFR
ncbi:penicillin-binding protein 1B [Thiohalomonas denitrificans]|uniref:penicillin-binding protein 1B n=1 Tax=Thiohalomonas denitrificans TaxID=415747 RepID=UPI0026EED8D0|nr:penicillin-binding protein 1B [Thiohalomonas denitrificans]